MTVLARFIGLLSLFTLLIVGFGFSHDQNSDLHPKDFKVPVIAGINDTTTLCLSPAYMLNAWYTIDRMDSIQDTLDMNAPPANEDELWYQFIMSEEQFALPRSNDGLIVVADTLNEISMTKKPIWASYLFHRNFHKEREVLQDDTLIQHVKSYPIFVANTSFSEYADVETQDGSLILVVEARNKKGIFQPIEYWSHSWCGNSYFNQFIPPRHMILSRGIKCSGDFYTQCRLKMYNQEDSIYSNEFFMSINETQFDNPVEKDEH